LVADCIEILEASVELLNRDVSIPAISKATMHRYPKQVKQYRLIHEFGSNIYAVKADLFVQAGIAGYQIMLRSDLQLVDYNNSTMLIMPHPWI